MTINGVGKGYPGVEHIVMVPLTWGMRFRALFIGRLEFKLTFGRYLPPDLSLKPYMRAVEDDNATSEQE